MLAAASAAHGLQTHARGVAQRGDGYRPILPRDDFFDRRENIAAVACAVY